MIRLLSLAVALVVASLITISACSTLPSGRETCGNGVDDDNNGLVDCADPDCKGKAECFYDGGFFGSCSKCGQACVKQSDCLQTSFFNDVPLPVCMPSDGGAALKCAALRQPLQVNMTLNAMAYNGTTFATIATRFIDRQLPDGGLLTCSVVEQAAPGRTGADARQLEESGKFSLVGMDVRRLNGPTLNVSLPFINVTTSDSFLIWTELWTGNPDGISKYPTGTRRGFECFDGPAIGQAWTPLLLTDHCAGPGADAGSGMCRTFSLTARLGPQP